MCNNSGCGTCRPCHTGRQCRLEPLTLRARRQQVPLVFPLSPSLRYGFWIFLAITAAWPLLWPLEKSFSRRCGLQTPAVSRFQQGDSKQARRTFRESGRWHHIPAPTGDGCWVSDTARCRASRWTQPRGRGHHPTGLGQLPAEAAHTSTLESPRASDQ